MSDFKELTPENINMFAIKHYDNPHCIDEQEFLDDMKRFKYLKRLFKKYSVTGEIKIRLVVNHIIVLQNVLGTEACVTLLLFKIDSEYWPIIKSVLNYLSMLYPLELDEIEENGEITGKLKEL